MGRRSLVLAIALALAAAAGLLVFSFLSNVEQEATRDNQTVLVWRAVRDIEVGTPGESVQGPDFIEVSTALVQHVEGHPNILCDGPAEGSNEVERTICDAHSNSLPNLLNGAVAAGPISAGQLITEDMFVSPVELNSASLSESIEPGKVALAISPSTVQAAGGFVRPGDRVNLIASAEVDLGGLPEILADPTLRAIFTGQEPVEDSGPIIPGQEPTDPVGQFANTISTSIEFTQTFEQDIKVIAVGADTIEAPLGTGLTPQPDQIIVVEVTPEQAERIEFARQFTSVTVMLLPDPEENTYTPFDARGVVTRDVLDVLERILEQLAEVESRLGT